MRTQRTFRWHFVGAVLGIVGLCPSSVSAQPYAVTWTYDEAADDERLNISHFEVYLEFEGEPAWVGVGKHAYPGMENVWYVVLNTLRSSFYVRACSDAVNTGFPSCGPSGSVPRPSAPTAIQVRPVPADAPAPLSSVKAGAYELRASWNDRGEVELMEEVPADQIGEAVLSNRGADQIVIDRLR